MECIYNCFVDRRIFAHICKLSFLHSFTAYKCGNFKIVFDLAVKPTGFSINASTSQFSHSVVSASLWPHGLQHTRPLCPSPTPGACSNSCPLRQWYHLILCCPFLLSPSIFPNIKIFSNESVLRIRWSKYWRFSFNIGLSNEYSGPISLGLTSWISLQSRGLSRVFSNTIVQKHRFFSAQLSL